MPANVYLLPQAASGWPFARQPNMRAIFRDLPESILGLNPAATFAMRHPNSPCILLIEDDEALARSTSLVLHQMCEARVDWQRSSAKAFAALLEADQYDAILLDLSLGSESGVHLISMVRNLGIEIPPIIIYSGQSSSEISEAIVATGAVGALAKPSHASAICHAITDAIGTRRKRE